MCNKDIEIKKQISTDIVRVQTKVKFIADQRVMCFL